VPGGTETIPSGITTAVCLRTRHPFMVRTIAAMTATTDPRPA
jgi:hypothetical protein